MCPSPTALVQPGVLEGLNKGLLFTFTLSDIFCDEANITPTDLGQVGKVSVKRCSLLTFTALISIPASRENRHTKGGFLQGYVLWQYREVSKQVFCILG